MIELLIFFAGFLIGWFAREWYALRKVETIIQEMNENLVTEFKSKVVDVTVEKAGDVFYIYRKDDGTFLAQGSDINKLSDILIEKFPGKMFNVTPEDLAALEATK